MRSASAPDRAELIAEVTGQPTETLAQAGLDMEGADAIGKVPADTPPRQ